MSFQNQNTATSLLNQAVSLLQLGQYDQAESEAKKALKMLPKSALPLNILGRIQQQRQNWKKAEDYYKKALKHEPANADILKNMGYAQIQQKKFKQAITSLNKALSANENTSDVHKLLAAAHEELGNTGDAKAAQQKALENEEQNALSLNELGRLEIRSKNYEKAREYFQKALQDDINYHDAWINLGIALYHEGKIAESVKAASGAVISNPEKHIYKVYFSQFARDYIQRVFDQNLFDSVGLCLSSPYISKQNIAPLWLSMLTRNPLFETFSSLTTFKNYNDFKKTLEERIDEEKFKTAISHPYLLLGLKELLINNENMEKLLTHFRTYFLELTTDGKISNISSETRAFLHALSMQCYNTEHVYYYNKGEQERFEKLKSAIVENDISEENLCDTLHVLGCYIPLIDIDNAKELAENAQDKNNSALAELLLTQVVDPIMEKSLAAEIPKFGTLDVEESKRNQEIYEDHPYPRWKNISIHHRGDTSGLDLDMLQDDIQLAQEAKDAGILIAGCGTGQHAISVALSHPEAKVLAIDYTLSSLAYAQRKTLEYGVKNITYMQADILELDDFDQKFDHIECSGVIHHINDDRKAFQILSNLLRKNGTMKIGVYSQAAREYNAFNTQKFLKEQGFEPTPEGVRGARRAIFELEKNNPIRTISGGKDFYALSTARFHIFDLDEQGYSIDELNDIAEEIGMEITEFDFFPEQQNLFNVIKNEIGTDKLSKVIPEMEKHEPTIFSGMYNFMLRHKP